MTCRDCYGSQTGVGSINTGQYPCNTGNAPDINTFSQRSEVRPNEYWNGKLMHERIPDVARRPSGFWPKPDRNCLCNIACRTFQQVDHPTLASRARSIVLPETPCGGPCNPRDVTQRRIREMRGFNTDNPRRTVPLAQLPEIDACNATLLGGAPIVIQRCPLQGDILYFNGASWCLANLQTLLQCYGCKCNGCEQKTCGCSCKEKKAEQGEDEETANSESSLGEEEGEEAEGEEEGQESERFASSSSSSYILAGQARGRERKEESDSESPFSFKNVSSSSSSSNSPYVRRYQQ